MSVISPDFIKTVLLLNGVDFEVRLPHLPAHVYAVNRRRSSGGGIAHRKWRKARASGKR